MLGMNRYWIFGNHVVQVCKSPLEQRKLLLLFSANHEPQPRRCLQDEKTAVERSHNHSKGKTKHRAIHSSRERERGREGGRADIKSELLSSQKLF